MLELIPKEIRRYFISVFLLVIIAFFLGLFIGNKYIYIAYCSGAMISIFTNFYLLYTSYLVVYNYRGVRLMGLRYILSFIVYAISMYLVAKTVGNKYGIIAHGLGLISFRLVIYFYLLLNKMKGKWGVSLYVKKNLFSYWWYFYRSNSSS